MKKNLLFLMVVVLLGCSDQKKTDVPQEPALIPEPYQMTLTSLNGFVFDEKTTFFTSDELQEQAVAVLNAKFATAAGWQLQKTTEQPTKNALIFEQDNQIQPEGYTLEVTNEKINIKASDFNGYLYAVETLRLLLPAEIERNQKTTQKWSVPALKIDDKPRFQWRGLMLDIVRHFFEKEYLLQTIDLMAMLKLNVLHLHLVDDQGWRVEIKKYPKLTEVGAWRVDQEDKHWDARKVNDPNEKGTYGGYYSQDDIREIVAYAHSRGIEVMPEIEMPAHVMSALAAYPHLSCHQKPIAVPSGGVWPITDIYCAGKESTFTFLEDVLTEVMDLFPSKYIHIGGDEATKTEWAKCPDCQRRMKSENLTDLHDLQTYFINRIDVFLTKNGRKLVGWDEIVGSTLSKNATVMSWRGFEGGIKASAQGNDVIMTPGDFCYLDQYQGEPDYEPVTIGGNNPLHKVYQFDPITEGMTEAQQSHILGGQGNLWSEYVTTEAQSQYMIFPRMLALSEALWSPKKERNWENFVWRTERIFQRFDVMGVNYAKSTYQVKINEEVLDGKVKITLASEYPNANIRYILGEGNIEENPQPYTQPILLDATQTLQTVIYKEGKPFGQVAKKTVRFHKAVGKSVTFANRYHKSYQGQQEATLTNIVRGTKNFHDKQWLAWLVDDATFTIDLEAETTIEKVAVGVMENQGQGIYYPVKIVVFLSDDNKQFNKAGTYERDFQQNGYAVLSDFLITFEKQKARYVKIAVTNLGSPPKGGDAWLFIDEILID